MSNLLFDPIKTQASVTDSVIVGFSGGKDSIVTMDLCFRYFKNVRPFFMYLVPGLSFQEKQIEWYERKYDTEIMRLPHFELSNGFKFGAFREPDMDVDIVGINDTYEYVRQQTGIHWIAAGERCADSIVRNAMIKKSGSIDWNRGRFYPLAYWKKNEVLQYIKQKKLYLSKEQREMGFSFRALTGSELSIIKRLYPEDYEKVLQVFPFAGAAVERFEKYGK